MAGSLEDVIAGALLDIFEADELGVLTERYILLCETECV
jgi:hypothetical protein